MTKMKLLKNMSWHDSKPQSGKKGSIVEVDKQLADIWLNKKIAEEIKEKSK